jgi:hypothetical protein
MAKIGLTKRIIRRKAKRVCRVCESPIGGRDPKFHLDAEATYKCVDCYTAYIQETFEKYGEICACCHFARESGSRGGVVLCVKSQAKRGKNKPWLKDSRYKKVSYHCAKWKLKEVEAC